MVPGCPCPSLRRWGRVIAQAGDDDDGGWCLGVVAAVHADGRLDVQYDNGDDKGTKGTKYSSPHRQLRQSNPGGNSCIAPRMTSVASARVACRA